MDTLCQNCQTPLTADAPRGLCPACLMKVAMATGTAAGPEKPGFTPPSIEELARKFPQLEIIELIGRGGMGAVYKARQKELDRIVALKILPPGIGEDAAFAERFAREAKALAKLNHPGIVTLYEFGRVQDTDGVRLRSQTQPQQAALAGTAGNVESAAADASHPAAPLYFFLMEFVDGVNLRQLLESSRVSPREALAIVPQICDALQFAHDQGIVHRDIKPENILLDRRGRVKVADFGLAKLVEANAPLTPTLSPSDGERVAGRPGEGKTPALTDAGKVMGTPAYMAPEQVAHPAEVDHRADIYALGVVFYQMLTGELPGKRIEAPSKKVQIDVRLDEVVLRALERKPELRYQQVSDVKTIVETIAGSESAAAAPIGQPEAQESKFAWIGFLPKLNGPFVLKRGDRRVLNWPVIGINLLCGLGLICVVLPIMLKGMSFDESRANVIELLFFGFFAVVYIVRGWREALTASESRSAKPDGVTKITNPIRPTEAHPLALTLVTALFILGGVYSIWDMAYNTHHFTLKFVPTIFCLPVGIGLLRLRPSWRRYALAFVWCGYAVLLFILSVVFAKANGVTLLQGSTAVDFFGWKPTGIQASWAGVISFLGYAALLAWLHTVLMRPRVKALFEQQRGKATDSLETLVVIALVFFAFAWIPNKARTTSAPPQLAAPRGEKASFGPLTETWIADPGAGIPFVFSFETGRSFDPPKDIAEMLSGDGSSLSPAASQWLRENHGDAMLAHDDALRFFNGFAYYPTIKGQQASWEELTLDRVIRLLDGVEDEEERKDSVQFITSSRATLRPPAAMVFTTRDGSIGVLQMLGSRDNPHRVDFRYRLLKGLKAPAASQAPEAANSTPLSYHWRRNVTNKLAAADDAVTFGPVVERVVYETTTGRDCFLDLKTGRLLQPPPQIMALFAATNWQKLYMDEPEATYPMRAWVSASGADLVYGAPAFKSERGLILLDGEMLGTQDYWKMGAVPVAKLLQAKETTRQARVPGTPSLVGAAPFAGADKLPHSHAFTTKDGTMGVLQVIGFTDNPRSVQIRYKLVQPTKASQELTPIPPKAVQLYAAYKTFADSYVREHDMKDANALAVFSSEKSARVKQIETLLEGTVADPLVKEHYDRLAELNQASNSADAVKIREASDRAEAASRQIERLLEAEAKTLVAATDRPRFQFRWVAEDGASDSRAEALTNASGQTLRVLPEVVLNSDDVESAGFASYESDQKELVVFLSPRGGQTFAEATASHIGRRLAIVWNGRVVSAPVIRAAITGRRVNVNGRFNDTEAKQLLDLLNHRAPH